MLWSMHAHLRHLRRAALVAAVLAAALALPAAAGAHTVTARRGEITAAFTYRLSDGHYSGARLAITRNGRIVYRAAVSGAVCGGACWPAGSQPMSIRRLGPGASASA